MNDQIKKGEKAKIDGEGGGEKERKKNEEKC